MQIDTRQRTVRLAVGELAAFRNQPTDSAPGGGKWRASVGQQWHKVSAIQTREVNEAARFEETIKGTLLHGDWTFELHGRIDQVIPEGSKTTLREVKTIRRKLPLSQQELSETYPEYFAQAATYLRLARLQNEYQADELSAELLFITIEDGTAQAIPVHEDDERRLDDQLESLTEFLNDRRDCRTRLKELNIKPAFAELREGQGDLIEQLQAATVRHKNILMQAPTGFGKTGIVLEHAFRQMQAGLFERCLYLTSKSTGQLETVRQLRRMIGDDVRFLQMRNRKEHCSESPIQHCTMDRRCDAHLGQRWFEADVRPQKLFNEGTFILDQAKTMGGKTGICPYTLTKSCLPYADIWIGDSNYLFAPSSRHVFTEVHGFDPKKTLLIVDEAHNLPSRNADALSVNLNATDLIFAIEELRSAGANRRTTTNLEALVDEIQKLTPGTVLNSDQIYSLCDLAEENARLIQDARFDYEAVAGFALDIVWRIPELAERLAEDNQDWLHWCPTNGTLQATCLDASEWTRQCLEPFGCNILMSATLDPIDEYAASVGLNLKETGLTIGHAEWRRNAYDVAADCRVDTRLRERGKYYETTARTIDSMVEASPAAPVVAFFPSYQYAENVRAYLAAVDPSVRIAFQKRATSLTEQEAFIDEALLASDVIFLIVGTGYAEGIDKLGGGVHSIIIIGPALPEVSPVQQAKMEALPSLSREQAFERIYVIPAMRRIHQALGRIVRAPDHKAKVLLHGKRYIQETYVRNLGEEYTPRTTINDSDSLRFWLSETLDREP